MFGWYRPEIDGEFTEGCTDRGCEGNIGARIALNLWENAELRS